MLSTVRSSLRGTAQPSTAANAAPVYEFRCLYTHDVRRKQKRWQDGFLKFHTFNRRVMVYDQPRNYIGDTHWNDGSTLYEGDELTLENGVIVEVADLVATTQTDLTELLQKKPREAPERAAPGSVRLPASSSTRLPTPGVRLAGLTASAAPKHKPLSQLLGTPKGPHGKAVLPTRSPFEERAAKRRKVAEAEQTQNIVREARTPLPKRREGQFQARAAEIRQAQGQNTPLALKGNRTPKELIDLVSDAEDMDPGSDVTIPDTPLGIVRPAVRSRKKKAAAPQPPATPQPPSSPPVSTTNQMVNFQEEVEHWEKTVEDPEYQPAEKEDTSKHTKKLRLAKAARPKMLLCQDAPPARKTNHSRGPPPAERQPYGVAARIPQAKKPAGAAEQSQGNLGNAKRPSEIRKIPNGLTPSSPPKAVEDEGGILPDNDLVQPAGKRVLATESAPKQTRPNFKIQAIAAQSRRIRSENDKPAGKPPEASKSFDESRAPGQERLRERLAPQKQQLQRSASLNMAGNRAAEREMTPPSPVVDTDIGPWSTEAMDLFDWKPPGYVFRGQGKGFGAAEGEPHT